MYSNFNDSLILISTSTCFSCRALPRTAVQFDRTILYKYDYYYSVQWIRNIASPGETRSFENSFSKSAILNHAELLSNEQDLEKIY